MRPDRRARERKRAGVGVLLAVGAAGAVAWLLVPAGGDAAAPRQAALPPTVITEPADQVQATSAVLHAAVNPNGSPTTYRFRYGRTTSYGKVTPRSSAGFGTTPVEVAATIGGLRSGATYHFQISATNEAGTVQGADATFATPQLEPRLQGRFRLRLRVKSAGGIYGHLKGELAHRIYSFQPRCNASTCPTVRLTRRAQRGHFRSTLDRVGPGAYRGVERFRGGLCDDGLRFHSWAPIKVAVTRARGVRAERIKGELKVLVSGCAHGRERARFTGRARG
jgi:hypothetical protein